MVSFKVATLALMAASASAATLNRINNVESEQQSGLMPNRVNSIRGSSGRTEINRETEREINLSVTTPDQPNETEQDTQTVILTPGMEQEEEPEQETENEILTIEDPEQEEPEQENESEILKVIVVENELILAANQQDQEETEQENESEILNVVIENDIILAVNQQDQEEFKTYLGYLQLAPESVFQTYEFKVDEDVMEISNILRESLLDEPCSLLECLQESQNTPIYKPTPVEAKYLYSLGKDAQTVATLLVNIPDAQLPMEIPQDTKITARVQGGDFVTATVFQQTEVTAMPFSLKVVYDRKSSETESCVPEDSQFSVVQTENCLEENGSIVLEFPNNLALRASYEQSESPEIMTDGSIEMMLKTMIEDYESYVNPREGEEEVESKFVNHMSQFSDTYGSLEIITEMVLRIIEQPLPQMIQETEREISRIGFSIDDIPFETMPAEAKSYVVERMIELNILTTNMLRHSELALALCEKAKDVEINPEIEQQEQQMQLAKETYELIGALFTGSQLWQDYEKDGSSVFKVFEQESHYWDHSTSVTELENEHQIQASVTNKEWMNQFISGLETFESPESQCSFKPQITEMNRLMNIPVMQGLLRVASLFENKPQWTMQDRSDALVYSITALPVMEANCGPECDTTPIIKMTQVFDVSVFDYNLEEPYTESQIVYKPIEEIDVDFQEVVEIVENSMLAMQISCSDLGVEQQEASSSCDFSKLEQPKEFFMNYKFETDVTLETDVSYDILKIYDLLDMISEIETLPTPAESLRVSTSEEKQRLAELYEYGEFTTAAELEIDPSEIEQLTTIPKGTKILAKSAGSEEYDIIAYLSEQYEKDACEDGCTNLKIVYVQTNMPTCEIKADPERGSDLSAGQTISYEVQSNGCIHPENEQSFQVVLVDELGEMEDITLSIVADSHWNVYSIGRYSDVSYLMWEKFEEDDTTAFEHKTMHLKMAEYWTEKSIGEEFEREKIQHDFSNRLFEDLILQEARFQTLPKEVALKAAKKIILTTNMLPVVVSELYQSHAYAMQSEIEAARNSLDKAVAYFVGSAPISEYEGSASIAEMLDQIAIKMYETFVEKEQETPEFESQFKLREDPFETTYTEPETNEKENPHIESLALKKIMVEFVNMQQLLDSVGMSPSGMTQTLKASITMVEELLYACTYQETTVLAATTDDMLDKMSYEEQVEIESSVIALANLVSPLHYGIIYDLDGETVIYKASDIPDRFSTILYDNQFEKDESKAAFALIETASHYTMPELTREQIEELVYSIIVDGKELNLKDRITENFETGETAF